MGSQRPARTFPPLPICPSYCHTVQQSGRGSGQLCPGGHLKWRGAWRGGYTATPSPSEGPAPGEMDPCGRGKREDRPCWVLWCEERSCSLASLSTPQECRLLRNFSSVYAVVSALQSSPIHRLRAAWGEAARWGGWGTKLGVRAGKQGTSQAYPQDCCPLPPGTASKSSPASVRFSLRRIIILRAGSYSCR